MKSSVVENTFTFLHPSRAVSVVAPSTQVSELSQEVNAKLVEASNHLRDDELDLAYTTYREIAAMLVKLVDPDVPRHVATSPVFRPPRTRAVLLAMADAAGRLLASSAPPLTEVPTVVTPPAVAKEVTDVTRAFQNLGITPGKTPALGKVIADATRAAQARQFTEAVRLYQGALKDAANDPALLADLQHDLDLVTQEAAGTGGTRGGIAPRTGLAAAPASIAGSATIAAAPALAASALHAAAPALAVSALAAAPVLAASALPVRSALPGRTVLVAPLAVELPRAEALPLRAEARLASRIQVDRFVMAGAAEQLEVAIAPPGSAKPGESIIKLHEMRKASKDLGILSGFTQTPVTMTAYLPHIYFFVVPMGMGDALFGLGDFAGAEAEYLEAAGYDYITDVEAYQVWSRLADLYLEWGDQTYRQGGNDAASWTAAAALYARIVRRDRTVDPASPLYSTPALAAIRPRVETAAHAPDPLALAENPLLIAAVLAALSRMTQIDAGLNFLGFPPDYAPPFTFEYLQNTARYFAQQAARLEQLYINFKSRAELEELNRDQLAQQVEVARATVSLEQRNLDESNAGLRVAQASQHYAQVQIDNARASRDAFAAVRWELLEYAEAEAWSSAAAVDEDDEVQQTWNGHYYSSDSKDRSDVLQDLAYRRTRISHDLEAARLNREIASSQAYKLVTDAQVGQAGARVQVAQQRIAIARLQASHAADNLQFIDHKEFGQRAWYEMARWLLRISSRYFDSAVAAAFLMERAYFLETGRDLRRIRFEAQGPGRGVLAGEILAADIDSFTQDFLATTRSRKAPVKLRLAFADEFPFAFDTLKRTGACQFATTFEHFHRGYPGLWLAKIRNVEVVFVGVTGASGIQGTLRTVGVSQHRDQAGGVLTLPTVPDALPLSVFEPRQDTLLYRFSPSELRVFENCGAVTQWRLDLPLDANDFDYKDLLDIHLVLYLDGFYDPALEAATRAALPATGAASRSIPASLYWPDELFYLRNQREARFELFADSFPRAQTDLRRTRAIVKLRGATALVAGLTVRLTSDELGATITATTDADGAIDSAVAGSPLSALLGRPVIDRWTIAIRAEDNPGRFPDGELGAPGLADATIVLEYGFRYRTAP